MTLGAGCCSRMPLFAALFYSRAATIHGGVPLPVGRRIPLSSVETQVSSEGRGEPPGCRCEAMHELHHFDWLQANLKIMGEGGKSCSRRGAKMPEGNVQWPRFIFSTRSCSYIYDPPNESKLALITEEKYCRLCREPVEVPIRHCAWWDHVTRMAAIRLTAIYPRRWEPAVLERDAQAVLPATVMTAQRPHPFCECSAGGSVPRDLCSCFVFEKEAIVRRAELRALLRFLCAETECGAESYAPALRESLLLNSHSSSGASVGERTFREFISRQITILLPPMAPEPTTRLQQRCWGRKNLEIMFDLLEVGNLQQLVGAPVKAVTKTEKATVMRQIVYELASVLAECDTAEVMMAGGVRCSKDTSSRAKNEATILTRLVVEMTLQRLSHELIHLHMMILMDQVWDIYAGLGYPSEEALEDSSFC
ncbi:hypothetical protein ERJ75_000258600 [Trypanosoma vivax]|uniref:Uncharacterized protein n=1 Tax=Trypanosoma vivax (strain Y486) TaxID=1055687 RepID=G0U227_TRYVY|nr:hypothetical protein TRVL_02764 [Trypanosoma vivax]KAH8618721.1 hypothetical protein ERJ75_000258600 [Trypanosoma vivax]CCC50330.1 conserved hypothetical protein [Trypanosoma vivax Y486]